METGSELDTYLDNLREFVEGVLENYDSLRSALKGMNDIIKARLIRLGWEDEFRGGVSRASLSFWRTSQRQEISHHNYFLIGVYKGYPPHLAAHMACCDLYGVPYKIPEGELSMDGAALLKSTSARAEKILENLDTVLKADRTDALRLAMTETKQIVEALTEVAERSTASVASIAVAYKNRGGSKNLQKGGMDSAQLLNPIEKTSEMIGVLEKESDKRMAGAIGRLIRDEMAMRGLNYQDSNDMERFLALLPSNRQGIAFSVMQVVNGSLPTASREIMADLASALRSLTGDKKYTAAYLERLQGSSNSYSH